MRLRVLMMAAVVLVSPLVVRADNSKEKGTAQALSLMGGLDHLGNSGREYNPNIGIGWEMWTGRSRVFGFYCDGAINSLGILSYGVSIRPLGRRSLDPYLQLGFMYARGGDEEEYFAMPVTLGLGWWLGGGFGLKAQFRYQTFCKETMYGLTAGFFFVL